MEPRRPIYSWLEMNAFETVHKDLQCFVTLLLFSFAVYFSTAVLTEYY